MKKHLIKTYLFLSSAAVMLTSLVSCEKMYMSDFSTRNATEVFTYLWNRVDQRYSLFDVKEVDWSAMYDSLRPEVYDGMTDDSLFAVLHKLLNSLNDGHVDLWSDNDISSSEQIFLQRYGNGNFDINTVALTYLRPDHHTTGGLAYNSIADGQVLYIRYSSFSNSASTGIMRSLLPFPRTFMKRLLKSMRSRVRPASSERRMPVS